MAEQGTPDPGSVARGGQPDLEALREYVTALLDEVVEGGRLVDLGEIDEAAVPEMEAADGSDEAAVGAEGERGGAAESRSGEDALPVGQNPREALEVTDSQLAALDSAHDALAEALQTLDSGRG
ncbi:hypothetical protein [Dietzia sp.]|uniref:hypothetical protein n=1 Tax=Dietzia sp. TaxID=1871616 RepID=UPI002FDB43F0